MKRFGKNLMRAAVCAAVIALLFGITACKQFTADIDEELGYWAAEVIFADYSFDKPTQAADGVLCVPSADDVTVTVKLHNPKRFTLVTPTSSANAQNLIRFPEFSASQQPAYNTDYTLEQTPDKQALKLTYKSGFLKDHEWGTKDIGADISLISTDGRKFSKNFSLNLKANTPPPKPTAVLAQTNSASPTYVLCLQVPDMTETVPGGKLHEDIARIEINGASYPLPLNDTKTDFVRPSDAQFIDESTVTQLVGYPSPPSGNWVLYYDTGLAVGSAYQPYTVKLKDNKGLVSQTLETGTDRPPLPAETVTITRGQPGAGSGTSADPVIINGETSAPEAQITIQNSAGTIVHCTVQEVVGGSATGPVSPYNGNPVNVPLGLAGANEKLYKVEYNTDGTGYTPTLTTTKYYKVLKCHRVTFHANGGTFLSGSTLSVLVPHNTQAAAPSTPPTRAGYTLGGSWYKDQACTPGQEWDFTTPVISNISLYAKWTAKTDTPYRVEHYQELRAAAGQYPSSPTDTENLTGTTGTPISVTLKTYTGFEFDRQDPASATIAGDGSTVVKVYYKRKTVNVTFNLNGGNISGNTSSVTRRGRFGTSLAVPQDPVRAGYRFDGWTPPLSLPPVFPANDTEFMAQWTQTYTVRFCVESGVGSLTAQIPGGTPVTSYDSTLKTISNILSGTAVTFTAAPDLAW